MTKYLVVGSPGKYTVISVEKGEKDYESGMSEQQANETRDVLNAQFVSGTTTAIPVSEPKQDLSTTSFAEPELEPAPQPEVKKEESVIDKTKTMAAAAQVIQSDIRFETDYIKNFVANQQAIRKAQAENKDTRSLVEKETDYIKNFVEEIVKPADPGDIDYGKQLEDETNYIKNYVNNVVDKVEIEKEKDTTKNEDEIIDIVVQEEKELEEETTTVIPDVIEGEAAIPPPGGIQLVDLNNVPRDSYIWNVDNQLYVAYEVYRNDLVEAGLISKDAPIPTISPIRKEDFDRVAILFSGDTNQLTQDNRNPFASFTETITEQSQVAPWITDTQAIGLIAEAALEGREVTDAEWQSTNWYQTHNEGEREWLRTYYSDPSTAAQLTTDSQIAVANSLQAAGVSDAPEALINWVAGKYVSGEWSQTYTSEQVNLFADPYATGKRDASFENYLSSTALTGVDRTTEREREVTELYNKWLGPSLGKLTDSERAEIAGRLRDDPDYQDQLVNSLKQSRLAAFSNYTNPELTYEDIARPWRNLTTSVWGQTADETQGWWQEMVKTNDFAQAQTTLREKGLEQDVTQVTTDATQALQQALGQGSVSQTGVNV